MKPEEIDLGTLVVSKSGTRETVLIAPSGITRGVWLLGAAGNLVFLWSVGLSLGWWASRAGHLTFIRWPTLTETLFWLVPVLLLAGCLTLAAGGVRVSLTSGVLTVYSLWPAKSIERFCWTELEYARFWEETRGGHEKLYAMRFVFAGKRLTLRVADEKLWRQLQERFLTL